MMGLWMPVGNGTSLCRITDHIWTSEKESQSGYSFKVIIVFLSYCGPSCMHAWCPPAWPRSDSEGYKEYVLRPGLIDEVTPGAVQGHMFSLYWCALPGHRCLDYQRLL